MNDLDELMGSMHEAFDLLSLLACRVLLAILSSQRRVNTLGFEGSRGHSIALCRLHVCQPQAHPQVQQILTLDVLAGAGTCATSRG